MFKCFKDGKADNYEAFKFELELAYVEDTSKTIKDFFVLPPGLGLDPTRQKEVDLYLNSTREDVKPNKNNTGFQWRKLKHFLGHAGLPIQADGQIGKFSGKLLRVWTDGAPRTIVATILPPAPGGRFKSIEPFSYKDSESTVNRKNSGYSAPTVSAPKQSAKSKSVQESVADVDI